MINVNTAGVTFDNGLPTSGLVQGWAFSPTFNVSPWVTLDHDTGTVLVDGSALGFILGTFMPGAPEDCVVDFLDLRTVRKAFFSTPNDVAWNPEVDFDGSGVVDFADLEIVKSQLFGPPGPSGRGCNSPGRIVSGSARSADGGEYSLRKRL